MPGQNMINMKAYLNPRVFQIVFKFLDSKFVHYWLKQRMTIVLIQSDKADINKSHTLTYPEKSWQKFLSRFISLFFW